MGAGAAPMVVAPAWRRSVPLVAVAGATLAIVTDTGTTVENLVAVATVVPFAVWAWRPAAMPTLVLVALVAGAQVLAQRSGEVEPLFFLLSLAVTVVGAWERSRLATLVGASLAVATPAVVEALHHDEIDFGIWMAGILLPLLLGRMSRWQFEVASQLAEARQELARQAVLEEKQRIARDVHDLVGHGLAAMLLHVTGARHLLWRDREQADDGLAEAEAVGRRSLEELRRTLRMLRAPEGEPSTNGEAPLPGATNIADAVQAARSAGVDAGYRVIGDLERIDPIVGLSLHRVVEEALANAGRHAPEAVTDVVLSVEEDAVVLTVDCVGALAETAVVPRDPERPRYGLVGMRERMAVVGGELEAGPTRTGWLVQCRAPLVVRDASPRSDA